MKRWRLFSRKEERGSMTPGGDRADAPTLQEFAGKWVAIYDGRIVAAFDTFDRLYEHLADKRHFGTTILRVPAEHEPEMVGFG